MDEVGTTQSQSSEQALGAHLQAARKAAGLTQQELCQRADLSYSTLAKIERGAIKAPSIFTIQSIAQALNTSVNELLGISITTAAPAAPVSQAPKQRSKSGIRFIYFDINGCLVRFFHRAFTRIAEETNAPADVIETTFWHYNDAACRGEITINEFNRLLAERIGTSSLDWQRFYMEAVDPITEMQTTIAWVAQNYYVGLLSNIMPGFIGAMKDKGLLPNVDYTAIVDSSEIGVIKPEPKIYEIAAERSGVQPHEILLVDDSRSNLMAAERMGWHVLWFDDFRPEESVKRIKQSLEFKTAPSPAPSTETVTRATLGSDPIQRKLY